MRGRGRTRAAADYTEGYQTGMHSLTFEYFSKSTQQQPPSSLLSSRGLHHHTHPTEREQRAERRGEESPSLSLFSAFLCLSGVLRIRPTNVKNISRH